MHKFWQLDRDLRRDFDIACIIKFVGVICRNTPILLNRRFYLIMDFIYPKSNAYKFGHISNVLMSESGSNIKSQKPTPPNLDFPDWRRSNYICIHCGAHFTSWWSKNAHLPHCKHRLLSRFFKVQNYLFILKWNPLKRRSFALDKIIKEFHEPKMTLGACEFLKNTGILHEFTVTELKKSPDFEAYQDGAIAYSILKKLVNSADLNLSGYYQKRLSPQNTDIPVEPTITTKEMV